MSLYIISAGYDGDQKKAFLWLYDSEKGKLLRYYDNTGHKPYCLTNLSASSLKVFPFIEKTETIKKYDALHDKEVFLTKVYTSDPLNIGGKNSKALVNAIPVNLNGKVWEANIKYYQCYIYDRLIQMGMPHRFVDDNLNVGGSNLFLDINDKAEERVKHLVEFFSGEPQEIIESVESWARLLEYPAPNFKQIALDIEVWNERKRTSDPATAKDYVLCICMMDYADRKIALVLEQPDKPISLKGLEEYEVIFFKDELDMIMYCFSIIDKYPFVITFNGDNFDMRYLHKRALNLGAKEEDIPIKVRKDCLLRNGIHIDLYKFFFIRSIQIYAFKGKYKEVSLDNIGKALIGVAKLKMSKKRTKEIEEKGFGIMTYQELVTYCMQDAEITLKLTTFNNNLVMNLLLILSRIAKMPIEQVCRRPISTWIKSFMFYEHRRRGFLIPNSDDILRLKGQIFTKAIIKGKKYKGAIVVEPIEGIHFDVDVMDFASLYPSIIKVYNLGYQTVRCPHPECKNNIVGNTPHWICKRHRAIESLFIGTLRDLRVKWYKKKAKDKSLSKEIRAWYSVIEQSIKVILNASYGVFALDTFQFYCPPVSEEITAIGRYSIISTINQAKKLNISVIYGDTDSIFLKKLSKKQMKMLSEWSKKELGMDFELDKSYRYCVLSGRKKNYLGVTEDGEIDVKGLTGKKRHTPQLIKNAFNETKEILKKVKTEEDFNRAKIEIKEIIKRNYLILKRREWKSLDELAFRMSLGKRLEDYTKNVPQHVRAALMLVESGEEIVGGEMIEFVKTKGKKKKGDVKPLKLAKDEDVNIDKYIEFLKSVFEQLLDAMDISFDEVIGITKLERWMP